MIIEWTTIKGSIPKYQDIGMIFTYTAITTQPLPAATPTQDAYVHVGVVTSMGNGGPTIGGMGM
jgi:hypothetical protein